ncbi:MAG TPA: PQQ-dependent sugar dehydrogenase [Pirellulaceae bacterium]|nr:PQQ-dependent sugar dehydrogenase [Pirellulaceae bacterium]
MQRPQFFAVVAFCTALFSPLLFGEEKPAARRMPWTTSRIQGSPVPPEPYRLVRAFPRMRFEKPTSIEPVPDSKRLLVTEMGGKLFTFPAESDASKADLVVDLKQLLPQELAKGSVSLFDAEFHPRYRDNRYLFVSYVHPGEGGHTRLSRFTLDGEVLPRAVADSERVILTWPSGGHNGGCLEFGSDGYLYISTGDGSGPNPPDGLTTGQTITDLLGAILRIDVDRPAGDRAYSIPADNPFVSVKDARGEIWSYGLRNPWKFGTDPASDGIFAADNGWESWELIHHIVRGGNSGWPVMEGRASLRSEVPVGPTPILPPVKDHSHTEANSVIGGPVYRGEKLPGLIGSFVYGDYITGTIWAIRPDKDNSYSHTTLVDTDQRIVAFTQGSGGEIFVLDYDLTGEIYELLPSDVKDTSAAFPRRLSQTGLFASLATMEPAPGVMPYYIVVEPWMDGAVAQRWVAIPGGDSVRLAQSKENPAVYPEGTVLVKHLALPSGRNRHPIRLETQILHLERGAWRPYSYLWDDAGQDAELVEPIGADRQLEVPQFTSGQPPVERTWHVSAINECKLCHNGESGNVLGFVPNQLNRLISHGSSRAEQSSLLAGQGVLGKTSPPSADDPLRLVDPHDTTESLDDRARSYLHVNCSMCHQPGGNAIVSFYLRRDLPFSQLNTNKGTGIGTFGMRDARVIAAGDPYRSLLLYRMSKLGYARMPYIGSRVVDGRGVALVEEWIRSLPSDPVGKSSAPLAGDSAEAKALRQLSDKNPLPRAARDSAIQALLKSTEGTLSLIAAMHRGSLAADDVVAAAALGNAATSSDVRGLVETFVPEAKRRTTLGANIDPQAILGRQGDVQRGKLIFFSDGARCRSCHEIDDRSKSLGPTLQEIVKKYPSPAELLMHVLEPSKKIEEPLAGYVVATSDGQTISGLVVEQTDREVVLKTVEKQVVRIARDNVEQMRKSEKSLMPDRILSDLTAQEAADLLEYLRSHSPAK